MSVLGIEKSEKKSISFSKDKEIKKKEKLIKKEKDRLIHIFTVELGNITAIIKGVNSPNAKLKFAGQPFCFAKFDLALSKDFYIVKGAELIDSFFDLTTDYESYTLASSMLEICSIILKPNIISETLFLNLIKSLQNIVYNGIESHIAVLKFCLSTLEAIGYGLNFHVCDNCGMKFVGDIKFDRESGTFRCFSCSGGTRIAPRDFMNLKIVSNTDISKLHTLKLDSNTIQSCLRMVLHDISHKLNFKFKSIEIE